MNLKDVRYSHDLHDALWQKACKKNKLCTTCAKGCAACCYEPLYVESREVDLMLKYLPPNELPGVKQRTQEWLDRAGMAVAALEEPHVLLYRSLKTPCPFLKDNLCLVYQHRPNNCRSHNAVGDPANCHDDAKRLSQKFVFSPQICQEITRRYTASAFEDPKGYCADHLGALLVSRLLGIPFKTCARIDIGPRSTREEIEACFNSKTTKFIADQSHINPTTWLTT